MIYRSIIAVSALCLGFSALADGHSASPADKAIKARNAHMALYSFNLGQLGDMAKGALDYDAAAAQIAADNLAALSALDETGYWPEGTDNVANPKLRATPAIWEKPDDFRAKKTAMTEAATALAAVAGTDLDGLRGAIGAVGDACGACHKAYRGPRP